MSGLTLLALLASGLLGVSDFLGGVLSRRIPLMVVLLVSQVVAAIATQRQAEGLGGVAPIEPHGIRPLILYLLFDHHSTQSQRRGGDGEITGKLPADELA